jgi:hypothetical protein
MKRNPTPENRGVTFKVPKSGLADSSPHPRVGLTTFSDMNAVRKTKREIWRATKAIKQAGCRDVLIVGTAEYVRFIVTIKLPQSR